MTARDEGAGTMGRGEEVREMLSWLDMSIERLRGRQDLTEANLRNKYLRLRALLVAPVSAPGMGWIDGRRFSEQAGERWRHVKSGGVYILPFGRAEAMVQCAEPITDENTLTVYIGEDGMIFARPTHEFHDGRFVRLPAESGVDADEGRAGNLPPDEPIPSTPPFIQWNGGENPAPGKRVDVKFRVGECGMDGEAAG